MNMVARSCIAGAVVAGATLLGGCTPPLTPYRNVGMVPAAALPSWDGRAGEQGHIRLEGSGSYAGIIEDPLPQIHDSALRVPNVSMTGSAAVSVINGLELGVRGSYANYNWASTTAAGTPPIPSHPSLVGFGPEIRGSIAFDARKRFALGLFAGVQMTSLPYARWELNTPNRADTRSFNQAYYTLRDEDSKSVLNGQIALMPSFSIDPRYGHFFLAIAAQSAFRNDGFATEANAEAVGGDGWVGLFGAGYGLKLDMFRAGLGWYIPLSHAANARYLFGGMFTLGVDFNVFGGTSQVVPQEPTQTPVEPTPESIHDAGPASF